MFQNIKEKDNASQSNVNIATIKNLYNSSTFFMDMIFRLINIEKNVANTKLNKMFKHFLSFKFLLIDLFDPKTK